MEIPLDELSHSHLELLNIGAEHAHDAHALCNDVAAMIFPSAITPPTEATISAVTGKLVSLVGDIEDKIRPRSAGNSGSIPETWPLLARSGFLRDVDLIDFTLSRVSEDRLDAKIDQATGLLLAQLLDHAEYNVADAVQILLAADSLHRRVKGLSFQALRPELLHQLCWRVVAALEVAHGHRNVEILENARKLLADYDEAQTVQAAARKAVHFLGTELQDELMDPARSGLHLHVAAVATKLDIDHDHVLRLIDSISIAPLALMLRASGVAYELAMSNIYLFKGFQLTRREIALIEKNYQKVAVDVARTEVRRWAMARAQYLMFQQSRQVAK